MRLRREHYYSTIKPTAEVSFGRQEDVQNIQAEHRSELPDEEGRTPSASTTAVDNGYNIPVAGTGQDVPEIYGECCWVIEHLGGRNDRLRKTIQQCMLDCQALEARLKGLESDGCMSDEELHRLSTAMTSKGLTATNATQLRQQMATQLWQLSEENWALQKRLNDASETGSVSKIIGKGAGEDYSQLGNFV